MEKINISKGNKDSIKVNKIPGGVNKKKIEIIATFLLVIIFIFAAARVILTEKAKKTPVALSAKKAFTGSKTPMDERLARIEAEVEKIGGEWNPFVRGRGSGASGIGPLDLSGIIWDEQNPNAIISNTVVREGDMIGKYKIIKINRDSVVISGDKGQQTLRIWEEE